MTGDQEIIAMRRAGRKPAYVWVSDFRDCVMDGFTVRVAGDTPELLDLRFLFGVTAIVEGQDAARVDRIANACATVAHRVVASTLGHCRGFAEVVRVTDTEGIMTWRE